MIIAPRNPAERTDDSVKSVLIISGTEKSRESLAELCRSHSFTTIYTAFNALEAHRIIGQYEVELVVINSPLADEFGDGLAIAISEKTCAGVVLLAKSELTEAVTAKVEEYGVFVLPKPISHPLFLQSIKLLSASCRRLQTLRSQTAQLETKIEEIRLVDRAKCALIQYLGMTEPQAHRYIEKQAMDMRLPRRKIAESILNTYEY